MKYKPMWPEVRLAWVVDGRFVQLADRGESRSTLKYRTYTGEDIQRVEIRPAPKRRKKP